VSIDADTWEGDMKAVSGQSYLSRLPKVLSPSYVFALASTRPGCNGASFSGYPCEKERD
jgi:hypothetical protein